VTSAAPAIAAQGAAAILLAPTPLAWVADALAQRDALLLDHANCEKKAASTALALMFAYPQDVPLSLALAQLAREELRHYAQVTRAMRALGVPFARTRPGRYALELRRAVRSGEPGRKLDLLLVSALIEARSAERFGLLAPQLAAPLARLYANLGSAEARHFELYLGFARACAPHEWQARLRQLAAREAQLATTPDGALRFHSGPLANS
jgi:tRNA 2-(methylsulfanyl)-N6-isopentenyladenosine37 hydroxylase